ncbi:hypothetical protein PMAYCL1PPCAC_23174, partial [Pristionchus mayeri]
KKRLISSLPLAAFPLQLVAWIFFFEDESFISPVLLSILVHLLFFIRVIRRGEKQYKLPFFYYQVGVTVVQWCIFFFNLFFSYFPEFWIFIVPLLVQLASCIALHLSHLETEEEETDPIVEREKDRRFKRGLLILFPIAAFPLQLVFFAFAIGSTWDTSMIIMSSLFIAASITVHLLFILYFFNQIKRGQTQFHSNFIYYEMGVVLAPSFLLSSRLAFPDSLRPEYFWLTTFPIIIQVIACTSLYFHREEFECDDRLPSSSSSTQEEHLKFLNLPKELPALHVAPKGGYEIL